MDRHPRAPPPRVRRRHLRASGPGGFDSRSRARRPRLGLLGRGRRPSPVGDPVHRRTQEPGGRGCRPLLPLPSPPLPRLLLLRLSVGLFLDSLVLAAGILAAVFGYALLTVPAEERYLRERLGDEYARYCERVPRFLPRVRAWRSGESVVVRMKGLRTEVLRAAGWAC